MRVGFSVIENKLISPEKSCKDSVLNVVDSDVFDMLYEEFLFNLGQDIWFPVFGQCEFILGICTQQELMISQMG